jgi:hypothetical protein
VTRVKRGAAHESAFVDLGRRRGSGFRFDPFPRHGGLDIDSNGQGNQFCAWIDAKASRTDGL